MSGTEFHDEIPAGDSADHAGGLTPLMRAASDDESSVRRVRAVLAAGADINARDADGRTALHHAILGNYKQGIVSTLIRSGADATIRDRWNNSIVHAAFTEDGYTDRIETVRRLIHTFQRAGLSLNEPAANGHTPLSWQIYIGGIVQIRALLEAGVSADSLVMIPHEDTTSEPEPKWPAICAAVAHSFRPFEVVELLVEFGANPCVTAPDGRSPRQLAAQRCRAARRLLAEMRARATPFRFESTRHTEQDIRAMRQLTKLLPR